MLLNFIKMVHLLFSIQILSIFESMTRPFLSFIFVFLLLSCYDVQRDCKAFHTGTFEFSTVINGEIQTSRFVRSDSLEIEYFEGKSDTASIRWVNACECILTKLNPETNQEKRPIQIKILKTNPKSYTFEYSLVGDSKNKQRGTISKLK